MLVPHVRRTLCLRLLRCAVTLPNPLWHPICAWRFRRAYRYAVEHTAYVNACIDRDRFNDQFARQKWARLGGIAGSIIMDGARPSRAALRETCTRHALNDSQRAYIERLVGAAGMRWR